MKSDEVTMARKSLHNEKTDALFQAILSLESIGECYAFFDDLCTIKELTAMVQRYEVADLLNQGHTFNEISEQTGASPATIARVNKCLQYGDGYILALTKNGENKTEA